MSLSLIHILDLLGLDRLFNTSIGGQLLQGDALLAALFRLLLGLAAVFLLLGLRFLLGGGLGLLRRLGLGSGLLGCGGLLLRLGLLFCLRGRGGLLAAGKVGVEAVLGYTVFCAMNDFGNRFQPKPLFMSSKMRSLPPRRL